MLSCFWRSPFYCVTSDAAHVLSIIERVFEMFMVCVYAVV